MVNWVQYPLPSNSESLKCHFSTFLGHTYLTNASASRYQSQEMEGHKSVNGSSGRTLPRSGHMGYIEGKNTSLISKDKQLFSPKISNK